MLQQENSFSENEITELNSKYNEALEVLIREIDTLLQGYIDQYGDIPINSVKTRIKEVDSALEKLDRKNHEVNISSLKENIQDMVGVRLISKFIPDVYKMREIIAESKILEIVDEEDYIKNPKLSGYSSYHITVLVPIKSKDKVEYIPAEIQLRTILMDFWAEQEHIYNYKPEDKNNILQKNDQFWPNLALELREIDYKMIDNCYDKDDKDERLSEGYEYATEKMLSLKKN